MSSAGSSAKNYPFQKRKILKILMKKSHSPGLAPIALLLLVSAILLPRIVGLNRFVTIDEAAWLISSGNFYYAIGQRDFGETLSQYHPAVTTMWIITAGFLTYFPEYRGLGQGYIVKYRDYDQIFASFDKSPLELLKRSRLISVVINSFLLLIAHRLLCYLYGNAIAWAVTLMIAFDPYFLGHSRLLNHEAMMSLFLLVSLLAAMIFIENKPHWIFWVTASISAGFALLTKSPSIVIIPMVSLILGIKYISQWKKQRQPILLLHYIKWILLFLGILSLTFAIVWPGMWVAPGKMLNGVFGNDLSYIFQGAQMNVANERYSSQFSLDSNGLTTYFTYLLWRTTPIAWLGVLFACIGFFTKDNPTFKPFVKRSIVYFGLLALIFILIFGIAKGRNSSHYILMSFVCLDVIAGIGLVGALHWLGNNVRPFKRVWIISALIISLIGFQIASAISQFPYYYTYVNPLAELFTKNNPNSGYGEGLEMAGEYLSQKPNARELTAISFFGYGPFSYFFSGNSIHLPPTNIIEPSLLEKIRQADYLVIYDIHLKRQVRLLLLMDSLKGISPEKIIKINNIDYVSIYKVSDLPESLFKSLYK